MHSNQELSIPALAARTVRDSRPEIVNNLAAVRHASVFEGIRDESLNVSAIQRIISAPILAEGKVIGVIQISRKQPRLQKPARNLFRTSWENFWRSASRWEN
jgi:GAF domain-containing protein